MKVKCPLCDRLIALSSFAKNTKNEPIMVGHVHAPDSYGVGTHWCAGSDRSLMDAQVEYQRAATQPPER